MNDRDTCQRLRFYEAHLTDISRGLHAMEFQDGWSETQKMCIINALAVAEGSVTALWQRTEDSFKHTEDQKCSCSQDTLTSKSA